MFQSSRQTLNWPRQNKHKSTVHYQTGQRCKTSYISADDPRTGSDHSDQGISCLPVWIASRCICLSLKSWWELIQTTAILQAQCEHQITSWRGRNLCQLASERPWVLRCEFTKKTPRIWVLSRTCSHVPCLKLNRKCVEVLRVCHSHLTFNASQRFTFLKRMFFTAKQQARNSKSVCGQRDNVTTIGGDGSVFWKHTCINFAVRSVWPYKLVVTSVG